MTEDLLNKPVEDMTDEEWDAFCDEAIKAQIEADRAIKAFSIKQLFTKFNEEN